MPPTFFFYSTRPKGRQMPLFFTGIVVYPCVAAMAKFNCNSLGFLLPLKILPPFCPPLNTQKCGLVFIKPKMIFPFWPCFSRLFPHSLSVWPYACMLVANVWQLVCQSCWPNGENHGTQFLPHFGATTATKDQIPVFSRPHKTFFSHSRVSPAWVAKKHVKHRKKVAKVVFHADAFCFPPPSLACE